MMSAKCYHHFSHLIQPTATAKKGSGGLIHHSISVTSKKKLLKFMEINAIAASLPLRKRRMHLQTFSPESAPPFCPCKVYPDDHLLKKNESDHLSQADARNDADASLAKMWREIQGSRHWERMLDPLNPLLVSEIMRYGVFVRSCYEAIDLQPGSKHYGSCKYGRRSLLSELDMADCGYKVTKYIYATPDVNIPDLLKRKVEGDRSNWIGYVAVAEDEDEIKRLGRRDIVVALRGTATYMEWLANFMDILTPARLNPLNIRDDVKVEMGFLGLYTSKDSTCKFNNGSAREQLLSEITRLVQKYKGEKLSITLTGHSMGSALAMLCAYDIAELGIIRPDYTSSSTLPITVYSFAGPRVGNSAFKDRCEELGLRIMRVVNVHDVVTKLPGLIFNENFKLWRSVMDRIPWSYFHVGVELALDHNLYSDSFKPETQDPCSIHDLATYLQLLQCCHLPNPSRHNHYDSQQQHHQLPTFSLPSLPGQVQSHPLVYNARCFFERHINLNHVLSLWARDKDSKLVEPIRH